MPQDHDPTDQKLLRLGRRDEIRPLRLDALVHRLVEPPAPADPPSPPDAAPRWDGAALRGAREAAGVSVAQLAERTKVTRQHLENIESERVERLPPRPYLRGFLSAIAKELRLDPQEVTRCYIDAVFPKPPPPPGGERGVTRR
ncbi:MAG: helix-turn-helix domain-containing protein [Anaeromyxobacteraceae bacterium]